MSNAVNRAMRRNPELIYRGRTVGELIDGAPWQARQEQGTALPLSAYVTRPQRRLEARRRAKEAARLDKLLRKGGAA